MNIVKRVFAILLALSCFFWHVNSAELNVFQVGQANFTILKSGSYALIVDCGYGSGTSKSDWIEEKNDIEYLKTNKKNILTSLLADVTSVTIAISHDHRDHKILLEPLKRFLNEIRTIQNTYVCQTQNWALQDNIEITQNIYKNTYMDDLKKLAEALGDGLTVVPILSGIQTTSKRDIHDKCLALKITINSSKASVVLPGDASGKLIKDMHTYVGGQISKVAENFLQDASVFLLSHHGSATENALDWYSAVNSVYALSTQYDQYEPLSQQSNDNGYIQENPNTEQILQMVSESPTQYKLARKASFPLLSIISSSSAGSDKIPTLDTIQKLLKQSATNTSTYYCVNHLISCYEQETQDQFTIPAFSCVTKMLAPIFSTQNIEDDKDGVYRISISDNGDISMYDTDKRNVPLYYFSQTGSIPDTLNQQQELSKVQQLVVKEINGTATELKNLRDRKTLSTLEAKRSEFAENANHQTLNELIKVNNLVAKEVLEENSLLKIMQIFLEVKNSLSLKTE